jgi:hypothetical protein
LLGIAVILADADVARLLPSVAVIGSIPQAGSVRRVPVTSGAVAAVGYDPRTNELEIEYASGDLYRYSMVPPSIHRELMASESIGAFVNRKVKPHYPGREIFDT